VGHLDTVGDAGIEYQGLDIAMGMGWDGTGWIRWTLVVAEGIKQGLSLNFNISPLNQSN
jgi:hypothetical protein